MAIKKMSELPKRKRATPTQVEKAKKAKPIDVKPRIIGSRYGRMEINLGTHDKDDVAGVIKGFRRKFKTAFGAIIKDADGNVLARTHYASGTTTLPEQLAVKALAKYGKGYDKIKVVLSAPMKKKAKPTKKATKKKVTKKALPKKPAKKVAKKKAVPKKPAKKKATKKGKRK